MLVEQVLTKQTRSTNEKEGAAQPMRQPRS
jgi:hypothetical protein